MFNLITKRAVGIDIAERTIEIAEVEGNEKKARILNLGRVFFGAGVVERGRIKDEKKLSDLIAEVLDTAKPKPIKTKRIIFALPESVVFTFHIDLKDVGKKERDAFILEQVKKNIPLPEQDLIYDYRIINKNKKNEKALVAATDRKAVEEWKSFFNKIKMRADYFDIEILSGFRGVMGKPVKEPVCLIDLGSISTNVAIFDEDGLQHSFLIDGAGESFTQGLADQLKIDLTNAEAKKKRTDLREGDRYANVLIKSLEPIKNEIKKSLDFFQEQTGREIKKAVLIGGSSKIKGLPDYFKSNLNMDVVVGRTALKETDTSLVYLNAIGSALRDIDKRWENDPIIEIRERKPEKAEKKKKPPGSKARKQIIALILILIVGIVLILLAFRYRNQNRQEVENIKKAVQIDSYQDRQILNLKIPVADDITEYTVDRLQGRLIEEIIAGAGGEANSRIKAEQRLRSGEKLWPVVLNKIYQKEHEAFIDTYRWLAYSESDMLSFFLKEVDKSNKDGAKYILNGIQETVLEATDNPDIFIMYADADVSFERIQVDINIPAIEPAAAPKEDAAEEIIEEEKVMVLIKETPTGWLNVRRGPSTQDPSLATVKPGEEYELIEQGDKWVKIKIFDEQEGWVYGEYVEINKTIK